MQGKDPRVSDNRGISEITLKILTGVIFHAVLQRHTFALLARQVSLPKFISSFFRGPKQSHSNWIFHAQHVYFKRKIEALTTRMK